MHQQRAPAAHHHSYSFAPYPHASISAGSTVPSMAQPQVYYQQPPADFFPQVPGHNPHIGASHGTQAGPSQSSENNALATPDVRQSKSARPRPPPSSITMPMIPTSLPDPSMHSYVPVQAPAPQQQTRTANRRSHNPAATLNSLSAPRPEELTDEYVLHPSVYAFKQEYPRRAMVGLGPYIVLQTLGEGEFGKVKLGVHADYGVEVAIKLIRRGDLQEEAHASKVEREINVLKTLKHPNIVRMFDVLDTHKYIGIVLEFAGGGELFEYILANEYLKDKEGQRIFAQLISGVDYLHKKGVIHRDLKLENLLLDKNRNLIITDFGFANQFDLSKGDLMSTSCGSPCYAAPELVVLDTPYHGSAVDIWSCGVILYAMLAGYLPYDDDPDNPDAGNVVELYRYIMNTELHYPDHVSPLGKNLLQHMLILHPEHRIKIPAIVKHPWLKPYHDMFNKSVEECEAAFQDAMYRKSKQARKELQERRRVQTQAREALQARERAHMQRSQSSAPGTIITAAALDQIRRRPHSAMPGSTPLPEIIAKHSESVDDVPLTMRSATPPTALSQPAEIRSPAIESPRPRSESMAPGLSFTTSINTPTAMTVETPSSVPMHSPDGALSPAVMTAMQPSVETVSPMRDHKNRRTIQMEYAGEAAYDGTKEAFDANHGCANGSMETTSTADTGMVVSSLLDVKREESTDIEMESGSSDNEQPKPASDSITQQPGEKSMDTSPIVPITIPLAPPAEFDIATVANDPSQVIEPLEKLSPASAEHEPDSIDEMTSPSTPRVSISVEEEPVNVTPRAKMRAAPVATTPKASLVNERKRHGFMPPPMDFSDSQPESSLTATGLPKPLKKDRYRKGMSLDKFGLAKLLGHASQAHTTVHGEGKMSPPSASSSALALQHQLQQHGDQSQAMSQSDSVKKSRRRTLQFGFHSRKESKASSAVAAPGTPLMDKDINGENTFSSITGGTASLRDKRRKTVQIGASTQSEQKDTTVNVSGLSSSGHLVKNPATEPPQKISVGPVVGTDASALGQNSPSTVALDAFTAQQGHYPSYRGSSSRTSKVMDWFRRKTFVKETVPEPKSPALKSDSQSSFVRVGEVASPASKAQESAQASTVSQENTDETEEKIGSTADQGNTTKTTPTKSSVLPQPVDADATPPSVMVTPPRPTAATTPTIGSSTQQSPPTTIRTRSASTFTFDESKIRVHTGLVDQSALSTKSPQDVFVEVIQVLRGMGVEMKRESDFKLRCTRAKKKAAGSSIGLGSVISTGSGMNPFSVMNNASTSKTDSRGLPTPMSPSVTNRSSAGIKGLLRRGSSRSSAHPARLIRTDNEVPNPPSQSTPNLELPESSMASKPEPLYGKELMDAGDEVKFTVELCKMKNLPGLFILKIKRTKGNLWSFKFIYQTVIERTTTLTH
ncbi:protein-serine/threonine kinase [Cryptococcus neoformans]|nr:protein-serine/threonine kinase [Cryptococcus neoformans var. grubii]OXC57594.1 protein-serine/threonine kinase [Cryptococcus neoformans var. grubii MW-RSA852]